MKRVGLALGGGVVRGFAHVGLLQVLEEAGISVAVVTGASVGAIVGAFVAAGYEAGRIAELAHHLSWLGMARLAWPGRGGLLSFYKLEQFIGRELNQAQFCDLPLPFATLATDLTSGDPVVLSDGCVARAVHASAAVPGVVVPVSIDGKLLSDGSVSDNIPVRAARALGADYVIACNLMGRYWSKARSPLTRGAAAIEYAVRWAGGGLLLADCLIEPDLSDVSYTKFSRGDFMIEEGRRAAEKMLPDILEALSEAALPPATAVQQHVAQELEAVRTAA